MLKRRKLLKTVGTAVALGAVISLSTFGIKSAQAGRDLVWAVNVDLTGPAAYGGIKQGEGFKAYVDWANSNGGIRGHKIDMTIRDTTFKPAVAVAHFKKALAQGKIDYLFGDSTHMIQAISPENNSTHNIFMGSGSFASELANEKNFPYHFVAGATYGGQQQLLVDYVNDSYGSKAKLAIMHSSSSYGRDGIELAKARAAGYGIEVVSVQQTKFVESDVSAFALAIRQAKPTHVLVHGYSFSVWPEVIRLVRDFGMKDVVFMGTIWQNEREKVLKLKDIADGLIGIKVFTNDTKNTKGPMMKLINDIHVKKDANFDGYVRLGFLDGWMNAMMAAKAFETVIDAGKEINGKNLADAMRSVKNWDTGGMVGAPINIAGQKLGLGQVIRWSKDKDWTPVPVSKWMKVE
jgi:branched-chain amino acid transport system substrate-binding protein